MYVRLIASRWVLPLVLALTIKVAVPSAPPEPITLPGDDGVDSVMYQDPPLPAPTLVKTFSDGLLPLWLKALQRPEADYKTRAALTIAQAHDRGMPGLSAAIDPLRRELVQPGATPEVVQSIALALIKLDASQAAADLLNLAESGSHDLREIVDPALAKWDYQPAREVWKKRLNQSPPGRAVILAMQSLATVRDESSGPRLRELLLAADTPAAVRLESARALGTLRRSGLEDDATRLIGDGSNLVQRASAAELLRHHSSEQAIKLLQNLARDPEPAIASIALARLIEINPQHVISHLDLMLGSPDAKIRAQGVEVLRQLPSDDHLRQLGDRLQDVHPAVRIKARRALRELARDTAWKDTVIREGMRIVKGNEWRGQEQAALLLGHLDHKPAAPRLVELLDSPRPEVLVTVAWGLRKLAVADTLPDVLKYYERAKSGRDGVGDAIDRQLSQLGQLFGLTRYQPADAALRSLIPLNSPPGQEARAAAIWALGHLHAGKNIPELSRALIGRLRAVFMPPDIDDARVRRMSAISLARLNARDALPSLREFYSSRQPTLDVVNNACGWALERMTGEPVPASTLKVPQTDWFLRPNQER